MYLKQLLKKLKLAESSISVFMGVFVVLIVGFLIFKFFQGQGKAPVSQPTPQEEQIQNLGPGRTYIVEKGEDLWKISLKFFNSGYNWVDIAKANNLKNPNVIFTGATLVIPDIAPIIVSQKPTTVSKQLTPITENEYQVIKGDNLWNISVRAYGDGFRWTEIAKANRLINPSLIHSGNILIIPR